MGTFIFGHIGKHMEFNNFTFCSDSTIFLFYTLALYYCFERGSKSNDTLGVLGIILLHYMVRFEPHTTQCPVNTPWQPKHALARCNCIQYLQHLFDAILLLDEGHLLWQAELRREHKRLARRQRLHQGVVLHDVRTVLLEVYRRQFTKEYKIRASC